MMGPFGDELFHFLRTHDRRRARNVNRAGCSDTSSLLLLLTAVI